MSRKIVRRIGRVNNGKFRIYGNAEFITHTGNLYVEYGCGWTRRQALRNFAGIYRNALRIAEYLEFAYGAMPIAEFEKRIHIVDHSEKMNNAEISAVFSMPHPKCANDCGVCTAACYAEI